MRILSLSFVIALAALATVGCATSAPPPPPANGAQTATQQGGTSQAAILINNQTSTTICYAMISANSDPNWGPDQLGANVINAGASYAWVVGEGVWDIKLQNCDHNDMLVQRGVTVTGGGTSVTVTD